MARVLAIEWDEREARAVVGNLRGSDLTVEHAFAISLTGEASSEEIGQALAGELSSRGVSKPETIAVLGRNAVELRVLTLPPAAPDDLPDMVRFQAQREFASLSNDSPLDFVELGRSDSQATVLAAATNPAAMQQVERIGQAWEGEVQHVVLRPFATASLWRYAHPQSDAGTVLLVDVVDTDADLTVLVDGEVTFLRTVRLPQDADASSQARALLGEIRRTMVAARSQTGGRRVDQVVWIGPAADGETILELLTESLEQPVVAFEPFHAVTVARKLKQDLPGHPGRFAPLLGTLLDEANNHSHRIDFLHPRRRPAPPDRRRKRIGYGAAAAAVALLLGGLFFGRLWMLDAQISELEAQIDKQQKIVEKSNELIARVGKLDAFARQDVTWLDEIATASQRIPPADEAILRSFTVSIYDGPGGRMFMKGQVGSAETIRRLEDSLRYGGNRVSGKRGVYDPSQDDYHWLFDVAVTVPPDKISGGRSQGRPWVKESAEKEQRQGEQGQAAEENSQPQPAEPDSGGDQSLPEEPEHSKPISAQATGATP